MIIDAHTHMMHAKYLPRLGEVGGEEAKRRSDFVLALKDKPQMTDVAARLDHLDRYGIAFQVITPHQPLDSNVLTMDVKTQLAYSRVLNDSMSELMEESKGRLIAAGNVPLEAFEHGGRLEMERAIKTLGLKAIAVTSNVRGRPLDAAEFEPFWALAAEMDIPVYIHPTDPSGTSDRRYEAEYDLMHNFGWPFETTLMLSRLVFSGIMERYPELKVVSHHLGGMIPFYMGRTAETYEPENQKRHWLGVVLDLPKPLFEYFRRFYYDTAVGGSEAAVRCAYEVFGADSIIFATDAPWGPGTGEFRLTEYPKSIKALGLPEEDEKKIFAENARKMLNL